MKEAVVQRTVLQRTAREPWAEVLTLGDARFGILVGGPFDGRCYPLLDGTPTVLDIPGPEGAQTPGTVRYVLREGYYRYAQAAQARPAA
jgi:hypothetical protein